MNRLRICEYFSWQLDYVENLSAKDNAKIVDYINQTIKDRERKQKEAERKNKMRKYR